MAGAQGTDKPEGPEVTEASGCKERIQLHRNIINCYLPTSGTSDLQELKVWYDGYMGVDANVLDHRSPEVLQTQQDELDELVLEACIVALSASITVISGFCEDCQYLFDNWPDLSDPTSKAEPLPHDVRFPGTGADWKHVIARDSHTLILEAAGRKGCKMCAFLLQSLIDCEMVDTFRRIEVRMSQLGTLQTATLSIQNWGFGPSQLLWVGLPGQPGSSCNGGTAIYTCQVSEPLRSPADLYSEPMDVVRIAKSWVESCSKHHKECEKETQGALPTRLVSVVGDYPHLCSTKGWTSKPRYSTLSHRWVSEPFVKLTDENLEALMQHIPIGELPQTFRDAIDISRRLGLEYIWIDSLCIIQGNEEDWQREAGLMSSVYGGSYINIAAASARKFDEGCFVKPPHRVFALRVRVRVNGSNFVREFTGRHDYEMSVTKSYLATRAWTLQEKLLPVRTIHFGDRGAFWECKTMTANEFLPDGFEHGLARSNLLGNSRQHFTSWWKQVVEIYCAADLSFNKDKLPAISGIARRVHEETGGQYLAGMWRDNIQVLLCWWVLTPQKRPTWRAPSWSWASVNGPVRVFLHDTYADLFADVYMHVQDARTVHLEEDLFGTVTGGWLRATCTGLLPARLVGSKFVEVQLGRDWQSARHFPYAPDYLGEAAGDRVNDVYLLPVFGGLSGNAYRGDRQDDVDEKDKFNDIHDRDQDDDGQTVDQDKKDIQSDDDTGWIKEFAICGIVLCKTDPDAGTFCRVGMFNLYRDRDGVDNLYDPFLGAFALHGEKGANEAGADVVGNAKYPAEKYVITIV